MHAHQGNSVATKRTLSHIGQRQQGTLCRDKTFPYLNKEMCRLWKLGHDKEFLVAIELGHGRRFLCRDLIFSVATKFGF